MNLNHRYLLSLRSGISHFTTRTDFRRAQRRLLSEAARPNEEKRLLERVSLHVHHRDAMYIPFFARHYLSVGLSALRCIERALDHGREVRSILDFPSGYGRVCRFLKVRFPRASITVSEIDGEALEFCSRTFSVRAVKSGTDFARLSHPGRYDLIWCGSLITHTDERMTADLLRFFYRHLAPGGCLVWTTHGRHSANMIQRRRDFYGIDGGARRQVLSGYRAGGYGYIDYPSSPGYGVSLVSRERMSDIASSVGTWKEIGFLEQGWDNHQDVYVFQASGGAS